MRTLAKNKFKTTYHNWVVFLAIFLFISFHLPAQWNWINPLPQGNSLRSICFISDQVGFAAGEAGTILKTSDGGLNWEMKDQLSRANIRCIKFFDNQSGLAVGDSGLILSTQDGGDSWNIMNSNASAALRSIDFSDALHAVAAGSSGTLIRTSDGGMNWINVEGMPDIYLMDVTFLTPQHGIIIGGDYYDEGSVYKSLDSGITWNPVSHNIGDFLTSSCFIDENTGYVGTGDGYIYKTSDSGETWVYIADLGQYILDVYFKDDQTGYCVRSSMYDVYGTNNGGLDWFNVTPESGYRLNSITGNPSGIIFGAGIAGNILELDNDGITWINRAGGLPYYFICLKMHNDGSGIILSTSGAMRTYDFGNSWTASSVPELQNMVAGSFADKNTGCVLDYLGNVWRTTDGGFTWTNSKTQAPNRAQVFSDIALSDPTHGFLVGGWISPGGLEGDLIMRTVDGINWNDFDPGYSLSVCTRVKFFSPSVGYIFDIQGSMLKTTNGGDSWYPIYTSITISLDDICFADENTGYIAGSTWTQFAILKSTDGGDSWFVQYQAPNLNGKRFRKICFADSLHGYIIGTEGLFLSTSDGGLTWQDEPFYTGNELKDIYLTDFDNGMIVGSNGTIIMKGSLVNLPDFPDGQQKIKIMINPNPCLDMVTISYALNDSGEVIASLHDLSGRLIEKLFEQEHDKGEYYFRLNTRSLSSGVYYIMITLGKDIATKKIIVLD